MKIVCAVQYCWYLLLLVPAGLADDRSEVFGRTGMWEEPPLCYPFLIPSITSAPSLAATPLPSSLPTIALLVLTAPSNTLKREVLRRLHTGFHGT